MDRRLRQLERLAAAGCLESLEALQVARKRALEPARPALEPISSGSGRVNGYGNGNGSGYGYGYGNSSGNGSGSGSGSGRGNGRGSGRGSGYGYGYGYVYGSGRGSGRGRGFGSGSGSGSGRGNGRGNGSGYGYGYGITINTTKQRDKSMQAGLSLIGKAVVVRSDDSGVWLGRLEAWEGSAVMLTQAQRAWEWEGALECLALAQDGPTGGNITPVSEGKAAVLGICELHEASEKAVKAWRGLAG